MRNGFDSIGLECSDFVLASPVLNSWLDAAHGQRKENLIVRWLSGEAPCTRGFSDYFVAA